MLSTGMYECWKLEGTKNKRKIYQKQQQIYGSRSLEVFSNTNVASFRTDTAVYREKERWYLYAKENIYSEILKLYNIK